jgi:hypothetical protein
MEFTNIESRILSKNDFFVYKNNNSIFSYEKEILLRHNSVFGVRDVSE